jgi:hypothetical protein
MPMRLDEPTPDELVLHTDRNRLFVALGLALAVIGVLILLSIARVTTLSCARSGADAGLCRVRESTVWGAGTSALVPLRWLRGAHVERLAAGWTVGHLVLHVEDGFGPYPFTWHASPAEADAHAARINAFVGDLEAPRLALVADNRAVTWPVAFAFAGLGGLFVVHGGRRLTVRFDRAGRSATARRQGLFGTRVMTVPFEGIARFEVAGLSRDCTMYLVPHAGMPVPLTLSTDWEAMIGPRALTTRRRETAERLARFCAPEAERGEPAERG